MKTHRVTLATLCIAWLYASVVYGQDMDKELSTLAQGIAKVVKDSDRKKVAVLDLTDLQGNQSELGRYLAEQITLNLVMEKQGFSVLDRANLNKILAEHKLTATGLVDPENAKKLGQFAGVDAIIVGNLVPMGQNVELSAKVIATDTAEIVGASKGRIQRSKDIELMLTNTVPTTPLPGAGTTLTPAIAKSLQIDKNAQQLQNIYLKVESLRIVETGHGFFGNQPAIVVTLGFANLNTTDVLSIALTADNPPSKLTNRRNDEFTTGRYQGWVSGLNTVYEVSRGYDGQPTEISPGQSAKATITYWAADGRIENYPPHRLILPLYIGKYIDGRFRDVKKVTFMVDIDAK